MFRYVGSLGERGWVFESIHDLLGLDETNNAVVDDLGPVPYDRPWNVTITNISIFIVDTKNTSKNATYDINQTVGF